MSDRLKATIWTLVIVLGFAAIGVAVTSATHAPRNRTIKITARKYAYDPPVIRLNQGDHVTIYLKSADVTHGFYLEGYDIDAHISPEEKPLLRHPSYERDYKKVNNIQFVANKTGKFHYRCSVTCGYMHPFMLGEMVVAPNHPFGAGVGAAFGLMLAMLVLSAGRGAKRE
ncbi:MAG TPA: hypothetical protein VFJ58_10030 [Armatimonadota bacterium]|nr:hypothetical protein [Armatimonadota bacterium]